jgi:hypothetical protein
MRGDPGRSWRAGGATCTSTAGTLKEHHQRSWLCAGIVQANVAEIDGTRYIDRGVLPSELPGDHAQARECSTCAGGVMLLATSLVAAPMRALCL